MDHTVIAVDTAKKVFQLHWVDLKDGGPKKVATLAIHVPAALRRDDVVVQVG